MDPTAGFALLRSKGPSLEFLHVSLSLAAGCRAGRAEGLEPPKRGSHCNKGCFLGKLCTISW